MKKNLFNLIKVENCPICGSKKKKYFSQSVKNLYSEKLSKILKVKEKTLLKIIFNLKCLNCSAIYKNFWFNPKILKILFKKEITLHPKGMDIFTKKFSKKNFLNEYKKLINYNYGCQYEINKSRRILISIINSIDSDKKNFSKIKKKINSDSSYEKLGKEIRKISNYISRPKKFSRFSGYNEKDLWNFLKKKVSFKNYYEIGCPSWGMLKLAKKDKKNIFFFYKKENNFWDEKKGCLRYSKLRKKEIIKNFKKDNNSLFGIIEYLDHLLNPYSFLKKVSNYNNNFFIITDNPIKNNIAIQHLTGLNKLTILYIAKLLNMKVLINDNIITGKNMILAIFIKK